MPLGKVHMKSPTILDACLDVILRRFTADLREQYATAVFDVDETPEQTEARVFILQALDVLAEHAYQKEI